MVDNVFSFASKPSNSFVIVTPKNNLIGKTIQVNKTKSNIFGNVVYPLGGKTRLTLSSPDAGMWSDLGNKIYSFDAKPFSGYHIEFGGIGTHAIMIVFQDKLGTPLVIPSAMEGAWLP